MPNSDARPGRPHGQGAHMGRGVRMARVPAWAGASVWLRVSAIAGASVWPRVSAWSGSQARAGQGESPGPICTFTFT